MNKSLRSLLTVVLFFILQNGFGQCTHSIDLTDSYGDGWNGGTVTVYVNGTPVLTSITLASGLGPATYTFTANTGNTVNVTRILAGSYPTEMRIRVYSAVGNIIALTTPVVSPGTNGTASCPCATVAGTAAASPTTVCSGSTTALTLTGYTGGSTFQWQSSPNNSVWTDIGGATADNYTPTVSANTYYRCVVTNGCSNNSNSVLISIYTTPAAPTNNAETNVFCSGFDANWSTIAGVDHYMLDVSTVTTFASFVAGYNDLNVGNVVTLPVTGLTPNTNYYYRVRAVNACGTASTNAAYQSVLTLNTPTAPTNNAETSVTCSSFNANWNAIAGVDHYMLDVSTVTTFATFVTGYNDLNVGNVITYPVTGLTPNTTYYYRVRAVNSCAQTSGVTLYQTAPTTAPLTAPTNNVETSVTCSSFSANWTAIAGVDHYMLDVSTVTSFASFVTGYNDLNVGNVITYPVTGLTPNTTYYYRVRAIDACGQISGITLYQTAPTSAPLAAPTNSVESSVTCSSFNANWTAITGVDHYMLDVSTVTTFASFVAGYNDLNVGNVITYPVTGLTPNTTYYYRVRAIDACGQASTVAAYQIAPTSAPLTAPTNSAESNVLITSFSANWSAITNVDHYMLDVSTASGFGSFVTGYNNLNVGNVVTYPVTGLTCNTTYYYRVRAIDVCGQASGVAAYQTVLTRQCNDECSGAIPLTIGTTCVITDGASNNASQTLAAITCTAVLGNADDDVWYSFVANCTKITITVAQDATALNYDPVVDLRDGCTGSSLVCAYNLTSATINYTALTVGNTYYIRTYDNLAGGGDFDICIYNPILTAPTNSAETGVTCSSFNANWSAIAGVDHYMLDVSTVTTFASFVAGYNDLNVGNVITYPVTGLTPNTNYYYRVRAIDVCGQASTVAAYQTAPTSAPLTAPTNNAETNVTCSSFDANWNAITNVDHYMLDVSTASGFGSFVAGYNNLNVGNVITYPVTGLTPNTTYYYRVRAIDACGQASGVALYQTAPTSAPLTAPTNSAEANVLITSFSANWSAIAGVDHYMLDVATNTTFTSFVTGYNDLNVGNVVTYPVTGLTCNTTYYYRVRAIDVCGQASGVAAYQTVITRQCNDECGGAIPLTVGTTCVITNGASNNASQTLAAITCTAVLGNADDDVWYSFVANCTKITITVAQDATALNYDPVVDLRDGCTGSSLACTYNLTSATINYTALTVGNTYYIRTYDNLANGGDFDICIYNPILTAPTNSAETGVTCSSFNANWSAIAGVDHYMLDVSTVSGFGSFVAGYNDLNVGNVVTYPVTGLTPNTTYYYRVRAIDACGQASGVALYQTAPTSAPLTAPTNNVETNVTCNSFSANWTAITNVDHYMLDVSTVTTFASFVTGYNNLNVGNVITYPVTGLTPNTTYYYRVRAIDVCGQASGVAAYQTAATAAPLTAPTNNAETSITCTSFAANWSAIAGVDHYMLDVSTVSTFASFVTGYNDLNVGNVVTYPVTGLTSGTNYYYRVRAVDACGQVSANATYQLATTYALSTAPTSISAPSSSICAGSSVILTKSGGTLGGGAVWAWYSGSCGGTFLGNGASISVTPAVATTYYVRAEGTCNTTSCVSITITPTTCYTQPTSGTVTYTTCSGLYTDNGGSANSYPVSNNSIVTFTPSVAGQKSQITFISFATESGGCGSNFDWLKIYDGPTTASPLINCYSTGENDPTGIQFMSTHASGSLTFEWQSDPGSVAAGWIASISCCNASITSQPSDVFVCAGGSATFNITAGGSPTGYQWQESTDGGTTWADLANGGSYSNVTTASMTINPAPIGMDLYEYRCKVFSSCTIYSDIVSLNVAGSAPVSTTTSAATAIGSYGFFANWAASGVSTYYLDVATNSGFGATILPAYNDLNVGNVTTYTVTGLNCNTNYYYRVRVGNGCGTSGNSNTTSLTTSNMCNDAITGAYALPNTNYYPQTPALWTRCSNVGATNSSEPATPAQWTTNTGHTVWFKFTAIDSAQSVSTNYYPYASPMVYDTRIAIYSSSNNLPTGSLTLIAANDNILDDANGTKSGEFDHTYYFSPNIYKYSAVGATNLTVGNTYFVRIDAEQGDIYVATNRAPDNDACVSAINALVNTVYPTDNTSATLWSNLNTPDFSFDLSGNESQENLIYYKFTPTLTGTYFINQWAQTCDLGLGTQFTVYNPGYTCSTYPNMLSGYDVASQYTVSPTSTLDRYFSMNLTAGLTYYFVIDGGQGDECVFNFEITKDVPLPIGLIDFSAACKNYKTSINWKTGTETNNSYFTIERSSDGINYNSIAKITGAGNSATILNYSFADSDPLEGTSYYRLSQTDFNGTSKTFAPVSVNCDGTPGFSIDINGNVIGDGNINISISGANDQDVLVVLTDVLGREIYSKLIMNEQGNYLISINPDKKLAAGLYFITASSNDTYISKKIVVK